MFLHHRRPHVMQQKNAFPPNFIHSLDSSHMMLTALHSEQKHITFVSVHDCYWTHPSSISIMNEVSSQAIVKSSNLWLNNLPLCGALIYLACSKEGLNLDVNVLDIFLEVINFLAANVILLIIKKK